MEEYRSNSHKSRVNEASPKKERVKKVISGKASFKKDSGIDKFAHVFLGADIEDIRRYIISDVIIPKAKSTILDTVQAVLYGKSYRPNTQNTSKVSYRSYYSDDIPKSNQSSQSEPNQKPDYQNIVLETRSDAEDVLDSMDDMIGRFKKASVFDLMDLIGKDCDYTWDRYGWTSLKNAEVIPSKNGYWLKLPKATLLNN